MQDATRLQIYLPRVEAKLAGLSAELCPVVWQILCLIRRFRRGPIHPESTQNFEVALDRLLRELGRRIVQWVINHLEPQAVTDMSQQFLFDQEFYRRRRKTRARSMSCLFGPVEFFRFVYQPVEFLGNCLYPLECQLGIVAGVATPALADWVGRASADSAQRKVLDLLRERGVSWSVTTLRKVTQATADAIAPHREAAQVEQILAWLSVAAAGSGPRRIVLSVGRDGIMLPIVNMPKYKEGAAATVSVLNRWGKRLGTVYLGQMPEAGQVTLSQELTSLLVEVLRRWEGPMPRLVYVTDCGSHPTEYFETVLLRMCHPRQPGKRLEWEWIVDFYHACLYITQLSEAIFGPGRAAFAWAAKQRRVLKEQSGGIFRVLRSAGALSAIRGLVGSQESYEGAYQYLRTRASKMDYRSFRDARLPIGSGVTEAACKIVFSQRFKLSGMKWKIAGGAPILQLRVLVLSGIWRAAWTAALRSTTLPTPVTPKPNHHTRPQNSPQITV